jgi:hypothetical protein
MRIMLPKINRVEIDFMSPCCAFLKTIVHGFM